MWRIPSPLIASGGADSIRTFDSADEYIGDLFTYLNSPVFPINVEWTIDGVDLGEIIITNSFAPGSTFSFTTINNGRILGVGGNGGKGGDDLGATGQAGAAGSNGGAAILSYYPVSVNLDSGQMYGGGGGGGGGAYTDAGSFGYAGGGGGGGQGFNGGTGGNGGANIGVPNPVAGAAGSRVANGAGGIDANTQISGGDGGSFGLGGRTGVSTDLSAGLFGTLFLNGGLGGDSGAAFRAITGSGATVTFSGTKSETTLRAESRILGETSSLFLAVPSTFNSFVGLDPMAPNEDAGITFRSDGDLTKIASIGGATTSSQWWIQGTSAGIGASYEVRAGSRSGDVDGTWTSAGGAAGTWVALSGNVSWSRTFVTSGTVGQLFELRRNDIPGVGADDVMQSMYHIATAELLL